MSETPLFSVVMPVYNKEPHIARAINSVLNQTFQDFELVIVCDPSTDNSNAEVAKFTDTRIRIFHRDEPGSGGYAARNLGIQEAKTEWIVFLDADDEWYSYHLEKFASLISKEPSQQFFAAGFDEVDKKVKHVGLKNSCFSQTLSFSEYLRFSPFYTSTVLVNRNLLISINGFPDGQMRRGGDVDTWLRAIEKTGGYVMSAHIGAKYYRDSENMVTRQLFYTNDEIQNRSIKDLIEKYKGTELEIKLKVKYNNQVVYAWNQNMHLDIQKNFNLTDKLYFNAQPMKAGIYFILSNLPMFIALPLHRNLFKLVSLIRGII